MEPTALKLSKKTQSTEINIIPKALGIKTTILKSSPARETSSVIINESCGVEPFIPTKLTIRPKVIIDEAPKPLSIKSKDIINSTEEKKFDLSYGYMKQKITGLNSFIYSELRPVLDELNRTNNTIRDSDILLFGKTIQSNIANKSIQLNNIDNNLIKNINTSFNNIIDVINNIKNKKNILLDSIYKIKNIFKNNIDTNRDKDILLQELNKNKNYKTDIYKIQIKYDKFNLELNNLKTEILIYIDVAKLLLQEFTNEGFILNIDPMNTRLISLYQSNTIIDTSIQILKMNSSQLKNYSDNIDNTVNILLPVLINKINLDTIDTEFLDLSNTIIDKLKV